MCLSLSLIHIYRAYAEAYRLGGVASGEHGIGVSKRPYFLRQTAKENLQAMNAVKTRCV